MKLKAKFQLSIVKLWNVQVSMVQDYKQMYLNFRLGGYFTASYS